MFYPPPPGGRRLRRASLTVAATPRHIDYSQRTPLARTRDAAVAATTNLPPPVKMTPSNNKTQQILGSKTNPTFNLEGVNNYCHQEGDMCLDTSEQP